jgi:hypothetical protein
VEKAVRECNERGRRLLCPTEYRYNYAQLSKTKTLLDIKTDLDAMNNAVNRLASNVTKVALQVEKPRGELLGSAELQTLQSQMSKSIGKHLVDAIVSADARSRSGNQSKLLHAAFQIVTIRSLFTELARFCCGLEDEEDKVLRNISETIRKQGEFWEATGLQITSTIQ